MEHLTIEANGASFHVARTGAGRPLLLLHGWPEFWLSWEPVMKRLAGLFFFDFVYPGIGQLMVDAVSKRDMPVVQACALIFATTYILLNLLADVISIVTNPRLLHPR